MSQNVTSQMAARLTAGLATLLLAAGIVSAVAVSNAGSDESGKKYGPSQSEVAGKKYGPSEPVVAGKKYGPTGTVVAGKKYGSTGSVVDGRRF